MAFASPLAFIGPPASNLLRSSSSDGVRGVPLRTVGRTRLGTSTRRDLIVSAKSKNDNYPWPLELNPDLNVKGGALSYLSTFKPLKENPKRVMLDFEKPLLDLEKQINDIQKMSLSSLGLERQKRSSRLDFQGLTSGFDCLTHSLTDLKT